MNDYKCLFIAQFCLLLLVVLSPGILVAQSSLDRARQLENEGRLRASLELYEELGGNNILDPDIAAGILRTATFLNRPQPARRALKRLEEIAPSRAENARFAAKLFYKQNAYDTALEWAERYRKRAPESWEPYHFKSSIYRSLENYIEAQNMADAASVRTRQNQWVLLDRLFIQNFLNDQVPTNLLNRLVSLANNPTIHWRIVRSIGTDWEPERIIDVLSQGAEYFPAERPPLYTPVDERTYRYWWSRMNYRLGNQEEARTVIGQPDGGRHHSWLSALLSGNQPLIERQQNFLKNYPDYLPYQWQHSRLARRSRDLNDAYRTKSSNFFYQEYRNNKFRDYRESAFGSLLRSLEMDPVNAERQFELARFLHNIGWVEMERQVVSRVEELGLSNPRTIQDYRDGLGQPDTPVVETKSPRVLNLVLHSSNPWQGPVDGIETLSSMFRQNLFHQPAFEINESSTGVNPNEAELRISERIQEGIIDGGIIVSVREWDQTLDAQVTMLFPEGREFSMQFYDEGRMKLWHLVDETVSNLKSEWPWEGSLKLIKEEGAWLNLGRVHGIQSGDTMTVQSDQLDSNEQIMTIGESRQDQALLEFSTPYYSTVLSEETSVRK